MELLVLIFSALLDMVQPQALLRPADGTEVTITLDEAVPQSKIKLPPVTGPEGRPLVVIDAGHGGPDPGAISPHGGIREKDVTLAIARQVRDELVASGRVRVALTRDSDDFLDLRDRYEIARQLQAELFISVHADAAPNPEARGATIYTLSEVASDREAASLAARENKADIIGGVDLASQDADVNRILIDLAQRESMNISTTFATLLHREASPLVPFRPLYHRFASLIVLKAPDVPSILFEAGYLTQTDDSEYIRSAAGQKQIAIGMKRAIEAHFARRMAASRRSAGPSI